MTRRVLVWLRLMDPPDPDQIIALCRALTKYCAEVEKGTAEPGTSAAYVALMLYRDGWRR